MRHGAAVLARPLAVPGGDRLLPVDPLLVPVGDARVLDLPLLLRPLMLERGALRLGVPRRVRDVLRNVRVDVLALLVYLSRLCSQFSSLKLIPFIARCFLEIITYEFVQGVRIC